jgi:hypothetical protein
MKHARTLPSLGLVAFLGLGLSPGCAGRAPGPVAATAHDEPLLSPDDSYREPPARGAQRPPPEHVADPIPAREEAAVEPPPAPEPDRPAQTSARVAYAGARGTIPRGELVRMLDQSPALFLRRVDSEPRFEGGRFRGWQIKSVFADDPRFSGIDVRKGDVVTRVNGQPIEQPDQFILVWQNLRQARELRVDLLRNGQPHVARWSIVD